MTNTTQFPAGTIFLFHAQHMFMSQLSFQEQRQILWETVEKPNSKAELAKVINLYDYRMKTEKSAITYH